MTDELGGGGDLGGDCQTAVEIWKKGWVWGGRGWPDQQHTLLLTSDLRELGFDKVTT